MLTRTIRIVNDEEDDGQAAHSGEEATLQTGRLRSPRGRTVPITEGLNETALVGRRPADGRTIDD